MKPLKIAGKENVEQNYGMGVRSVNLIDLCNRQPINKTAKQVLGSSRASHYENYETDAGEHLANIRKKLAQPISKYERLMLQAQRISIIKNKKRQHQEIP